jgi:hypothetical protein
VGEGIDKPVVDLAKEVEEMTGVSQNQKLVHSLFDKPR